MKRLLYKRLIIISLITAVIASLLSLGISATTRIRPGVGRAAEPAAPAESIDDTSYEGNIDSGDDGHIGENSGTGEFGDDTSDTADSTSSKNPVESVIDDVSQGVNDAVDNVGDAMENASGGINVWGIVIAVVIVIAIAALIFALFSRK